MKNIITGGVTETSFNPTAKFEQAFVERKDMEYSYNDSPPQSSLGSTSMRTFMVVSWCVSMYS